MRLPRSLRMNRTEKSPHTSTAARTIRYHGPPKRPPPASATATTPTTAGQIHWRALLGGCSYTAIRVYASRTGERPPAPTPDPDHDGGADRLGPQFVLRILRPEELDGPPA